MLNPDKQTVANLKAIPSRMFESGSTPNKHTKEVNTNACD
jgi:hypothetical protein